MNEFDDIEDNYIDGNDISIQGNNKLKLNDTISSNSSGNNHLETDLPEI